MIVISRCGIVRWYDTVLVIHSCHISLMMVLCVVEEFETRSCRKAESVSSDILMSDVSILTRNRVVVKFRTHLE